MKMVGRMKKILIFIITWFLFIPVSYGATYKIRNGNVINPNGVSQQNISLPSSQSQQQINYNSPSNYSKNDDDDVIYSQAQTRETQEKTATNPVQTVANKVSPEPSDKKIDALKSRNELYLNRPLPQVTPSAIYARYGKDFDAAAHKIAIDNKKSTSNNCKITTFTTTDIYSIWCNNNPDYSFYYYSPSKPYLIKFDVITKINATTMMRYSYNRDGLSDNAKWKLVTISIQYPNMDFIYDASSSSYSLQGYYIDNKYYKADGTYGLTRKTQKL